MRKLWCVLLATSITFAQSAPVGLTPGTRVVLDCHNCYPYEGRWMDRVDKALAQGFPVSIEQDLAWHVDAATGKGRIAIHHGAETTGREPGLRDYFFDRVRPAVEKALRENNRAAWPILYLHFDFKTVTPPLLQAVWDLLGEYPEWITTATKLADPHILAPLDVRPIMVLTEEADEQEIAFFQRVAIGGKLRLFGSAATVRQHKNMPLLTPAQTVSTAPTNYRRWWNSAWDAVELGGQREAGEWTQTDSERLKSLVDYAHHLGYAIRFYTLNGHSVEAGRENGWDANYNFGSRDAVEKRWRAAIECGVDMIATDQVEDLAAFMKSLGSR